MAIRNGKPCAAPRNRGGVAGHSHKGLPRGHGDAGYFGRAGLIQNFSAVTGACMIMRKANFLAVGGLDADNLSTALNDVDLCLKMNEHNLRIIWTPYADFAYSWPPRIPALP